MAAIIKYIPVIHVTYNGVTYSPAEPGQAHKTIEGLPDSEVRRLLAAGYIKKLKLDDGKTEDADGEAPAPDKLIDQMTMSELRSVAKTLSISVPAGMTKDVLLAAITEAQTGVASETIEEAQNAQL